MEELFLPVLHSFENNNIFTGSFGALRFKITPNITMRTAKEVDLDESFITCEYWYGPFCYEKSEIADSERFAMSEDGREQMRKWLIAHIK